MDLRIRGLPAAAAVPSEQSVTSFITKVGQTVFTSDARLWVRNHPWVAGPPYLRFYCGAPIPGRFEKRPGTWGPRRLPVVIGG